ncbi:MAG: O-antigen ligase family protein [Patescibacteria group bacterium]|jgi:O-antigen ligase
MLKLNNILLKLSKTYSAVVYLLAFVFSFQTRLILSPGELSGGYSEYGTISLYPVDLVMLLLAFILTILLALKADKIILKKIRFRGKMTLIGFMFFFLISSAASIVFASDKWLALFRFGWLAEGAFLFSVIVFSNYKTLRLFFFLGLGFSIQAGIAVWQFAAQSDFALKWLGMALHKAEELGVSVIEVSNPGELPERWLRAYGGLPHPNILGAAMAGAGLFCLYFLLGRRSADRVGKYLPIGALTLFFIALLASFSRSAWIAFIFGFAFIFVAIMIGKNLSKRKIMLEITLVLGMVFFVFFSLYGDLVLTRIKGEGRLENLSISERIGSSKEAWTIIKSHPFLGVGIGNYVLAEFGLRNSNRPADGAAGDQSSAVNRQLSAGNFKAWDYQPVHNAFLLIWAESGILGLIAFIGFLASVAYCLFFAVFPRLAPRPAGSAGEDLTPERQQAVFGLAVIASLAIMMAFDHFWMSLHIGVLLSFLISALVLRLALES